MKKHLIEKDVKYRLPEIYFIRYYKLFYVVLDPHAAFFLRTCPALAVGFVLRDKKLSTKHEELLRNLCSGKKNVHLNVCIMDRKKVRYYMISIYPFKFP